MKENPFPRKNFWTLFILFNLAALPALFFLNLNMDRMQKASLEKSLPVYGTLRFFSLQDERGDVFGSEQMKNRLWVANFMFTSCPNECPAMNFKMSLLQDSLPAGTGLLSFSVDPAKDTPKVLAGYAGRFKARKGLWFFLTGPKASIARVLEDCHFAKADDPLLHGLRLVLLDGQGKIRGYYDYSDEFLIKKLIQDIRLLKEKG